MFNQDQQEKVRVGSNQTSPQGVLGGGLRSLSDTCQDTCRQATAKEIMRSRAKELHQRAYELDVLANSLPEVLSSEADNALRNLLYKLQPIY